MAKITPTTPRALEDKAEIYYQALLSRDARFDGRFVVGVVTTGVYCRPVCPARKPKFENCRFYRSSAEAQEHGFRPCKRCRPEIAPISWARVAPNATIGHALTLIAAGSLNDSSIPELASRLGVTARHLRRLFANYLGVSPGRYTTAYRLGIANELLHRSAAPITSVAIASGFGSLRRFNSAFKDVYGVSPSVFRRSNGTRHAAPSLRLELPYRAPYDWEGVIAFLGKRTIPGLERATPQSYARSLLVDDRSGFLTIKPNRTNPHLDVEIRLSDASSILGLVERIKAAFDLDADYDTIAQTLGRDRRLRQCLAKAVGLRVPGGWNVYELGVRAILGQQVTVAGARTLSQRLVDALGETNELPEAQAAQCSRHFPTPGVLAEATLREIGLPSKRAESIRRFAAFMAEHGTDPSIPDAALTRALRSLPGIGPWTVGYIRLRALRDPDAFPVGDAGLIRAARILGIASSTAELHDVADRWRPWRSYATMALWRSLEWAQPRAP